MTRRVNKAYRIVFQEKGPVAGMKLCLTGHFIYSALVLCYSLIDAMAWLGLPDERKTVGRKDFMDLVDKYVLPNGGLECTAADLYSARCGVVHSMSPESQLTKSGNATELVYSWGSQKPYPSAKLRRIGITRSMIHVDTLCNAVERGVHRFMSDVLNDKRLLRIVNVRARKVFIGNTKLPPELP